MRRVGLALLACLALAAAEERPIAVFAAASLADALDDAFAVRKAAGHPAAVGTYAASSLLARQIAEGAPADLYVTADPKWLSALVTKGVIAAGSRRLLAGNRLVVIAPVGHAFALSFAADADAAAMFPARLALADPEHVPAGEYAREALTALGWWGTLKPRVLPAEDVRAALRLVELGEADAGIVYASDAAAAAERVVVAGIVPERLHRPITYELGVVAAAPGAAAAAELASWLTSGDGAAILARHGFAPAPAPASTPDGR